MEYVHTLRLPPTRTTEPGVGLELMVLSDSPQGCAAVDVSSGALVRAAFSGRTEAPLAPFDLVRAILAFDPDGPDPTQPEAVVLTQAPEVLGRMRGRAVRRLLAPLLLPQRAEPFGFPGSAAPYWTVPGDRPSLAVLRPSSGPSLVRRNGDVVACRFGWRDVELELPVVDNLAVRAASVSNGARVGGRALARVLGFEPTHLVLALTAPIDGRCYKVVAGFLPRP